MLDFDHTQIEKVSTQSQFLIFGGRLVEVCVRKVRKQMATTTTNAFKTETLVTTANPQNSATNPQPTNHDDKKDCEDRIHDYSEDCDCMDCTSEDAHKQPKTENENEQLTAEDPDSDEFNGDEISLAQNDKSFTSPEKKSNNNNWTNFPEILSHTLSSWTYRYPITPTKRSIQTSETCTDMDYEIRIFVNSSSTVGSGGDAKSIASQLYGDQHVNMTPKKLLERLPISPGHFLSDFLYRLTDDPKTLPKSVNQPMFFKSTIGNNSTTIQIPLTLFTYTHIYHQP